MLVLALILLVISVLGLAHTYLWYPYQMKQLAGNKPISNTQYQAGDDWPTVTVLMSVYNEASVVEEKVRTLFAQDYPAGKLHFFIGSDCSSDGTNAILDQLQSEDARLAFFPFSERRGKPPVINELMQTAFDRFGRGQNHILLLTDANVLLAKDVIRQLVQHFKDERIALVDAHMQHTGMQAAGISRAEDRYISREVMLKHHESQAGGVMIGPFGGCFALRSDYATKVPLNFLVDDFYLCMKALEQGGLAINELNAHCYEGVTHSMQQEFKRKRRIASGNIQNLFTFKKLWWPPKGLLAYAFFSHKVLRWLGPLFLILGALGMLIIAVCGSKLWAFLAVLSLSFGVLLPIVDAFLAKWGINILLLRGWRYFLIMNLALLFGYARYFKGIRSNVWEPTARS